LIEEVTQKVNVARGEVSKRQLSKTHCPQGHEYSGYNLSINPKNGWRQCKACARSRAQETALKKKEASKNGITDKKIKPE
jgi:hypothetical protein